jgi:hypothetical protein
LPEPGGEEGGVIETTTSGVSVAPERLRAAARAIVERGGSSER